MRTPETLVRVKVSYIRWWRGDEYEDGHGMFTLRVDLSSFAKSLTQRDPCLLRQQCPVRSLPRAKPSSSQRYLLTLTVTVTLTAKFSISCGLCMHQFRKFASGFTPGQGLKHYNCSSSWCRK